MHCHRLADKGAEDSMEVKRRKSGDPCQVLKGGHRIEVPFKMRLHLPNRGTFLCAKPRLR
jgi:hypothetical protein